MKAALSAGLLLFATFHTFKSSASVLYVDGSNTNPVAPYSTWAIAATNIQDALDAATAGDTVLVTNGVYASGSRSISAGAAWTFRCAITNAVAVQSVNGLELTTIDGGAGS